MKLSPQEVQQRVSSIKQDLVADPTASVYRLCRKYGICYSSFNRYANGRTTPADHQTLKSQITDLRAENMRLKEWIVSQTVNPR